MTRTLSFSNCRKQLVILTLGLISFGFSFGQTTIFSASTVPAVVAETDGTPIETGVKFRTSQAGFITGVRFYKGALNTGTHTGHLWSSTGTKLAEIVFTGESASGWQQMLFTTPVAVAANTTYIASYHSGSGYYAYTNPFFTTATVNGPLTALANGTDGGNGVYIYSTTSAFPNNSYQTTNYWVDVVYVTSIGPDVTPPTVNITAPAAGNVSGTINVTANASDNVGVVGVQFQLNGANLGAEDLASPYSISWNTTTSPNGNYTLTAIARDAAGNTTTSTGVAVTINNDTQAPTVNITAPAAGTVTGTINVTATAADNVGVAGVQFLLDGANLGTEDVASPFSISWNTATATNGNHTLTARARDAAGNTTTSVGVIVTASNDNQAPTINLTEPAAGQVAGTINVSADANDNVGVVGVQFLLDGANLGTEDSATPFTISWNTATIADGNHSLTARARDAAGNTTTSAAVVVAVKNDLTAPTVNISAPPAGDVSGTVNVTANASDNVGVIGVQFLLNGANLGTEDLTSPYSTSWNTIGLPNGNYTLTARARDASGNITTSAPVVVNVNNAPDTQAPVVTMTAPAAGNVSGTAVTVTATATDNVGVVGVQFLLNGANLGTEDLTSPYSISWNSTTVTNGTYTLTARGRDAAGNTTTSAGVVVTVNNIPLLTALPLNEGSGTTAADISGSAHPGTLVAAPTWGAGKYGQGLTFNGTSQYVSIADHADFTLAPTQSYTWSMWLKNNNFNEWQTVWSQTVSASAFFYFYAHTTTDPDGGPVTNGISVYWWNSNTVKLGAHSSNNVLTAGVWSHVAVVYDASQPQNNRFTIYVNGVDVTVRTDVSSSGTLASLNPTNTRIGANAPFGEFLNGSVDEVRFYKRLLTQTEVQTDMNTPLGIDAAPPTVNITAPSAGTVSGTLNVTANANDDIAVMGVQFLLDGVNLGAEDLTSPYSVSWNTLTAANGNHTLTARARDGVGNTTTSAPVIVNVNNDTQAPTINITAPTGGTIAGTINVDANASDNFGVVGVQFIIDGTNLGAEDLVAPYSISWNTATVTDGNHTLTARARDAAGNTTTSSAVIVTVANDPIAPTVTITAPSAGNVAGTINVSANASDNVGVVGVQFMLNGANLGTEDLVAPYSISWNTTTSANGNYTLTARARDASGNITVSAGVAVTINNDTQAPTVTITAPAAGTVVGTINVDANANDNIGVAGVQFLLDGANLGAEDNTAPYSVSWNSTSVLDGNHTLTARARDAAGNTTTSAAVIVNVHNDTQAPTVNITAPPAGTVLGTVNVTANATDNVGVVGVQFLLNGANLGAEDTASPFSVSWNTVSVLNGNYLLTARARDASGNTTLSAPVNVTVNNPTTLITALNLNEGTGTAVTDISGYNHHGTMSGATWVAGKYGQGANLNGTNQYINIPAHTDFNLNPAQSYTWSTWVKNTNFAEWGPVWSQTVDINNFFYFYAHTTTDPDGGPVTNGISVYWWTNGGTNMVGAHSSNNVLAAGQWRHVAITYDASQPQNNRFTIYVNGVDVTVRTDVSSTGTLGAINPNNIRVGSDQPFNEYINAAVDEVRFYKRLLTASEIVSDMNTPIPTAIAATVTPANGTINNALTSTLTAVFNVDMNASSINSSTFELRDVFNALIPGTIGYNSSTKTATFTPSSPLQGSSLYTGTIKGGFSGVKDASGNLMNNDIVWSFSTLDPQALPITEGPGGPILVISTASNQFSRYAVEILRAEGLNEFAAADIGSVTPTMLNNYDVVILGEMTVNASQVTMLTDWVNAGGTLIAFKPSALLTPLMGLSAAGGTLADRYLLVNTNPGPGFGIVNQTIQFHGTANVHTLNGATSLANLYSTATTATTNPAVSTNNVGTNGGKAVAFTYDLARSIVYTRQGDPTKAGVETDGQPVIRPDDLFFPSYIDMNKVAIPQADEQQRLLANIIIQSNLGRKPLPRFWYLPNNHKAAVVYALDDHGTPSATTDVFNKMISNSTSGCSVENWECLRATSWFFLGIGMNNSQAVNYLNQGFDMGAHVQNSCSNFSSFSSLDASYNSQLAALASAYPGLPAQVGHRFHCLVWSDWLTQAKVELSHGMRFSLDYYYWPPSWINGRPGLFTGSGMPMRFADTDGSMIDIYQGVSQLVNENGINYAVDINTLVDNAIGAPGYYGMFGTHDDYTDPTYSDVSIAQAKAKNVPVISVKQALTWLDGRNNSSFGNLVWSNDQLTFSITARANANNIRAMLPLNSTAGTLLTITRSGNPVSFTTQTIKGMQYAFFAPLTGTHTYIATYSSGGRLANMGPIDTTITITAVETQVKETTRQAPEEVIPVSKLSVSIIPNPSTDQFNLIINSSDADPVKIKVTDMLGRLIETHEKVTSAGSLRLGQTWTSGVYFAEVVQGDQRKVVKLIKTN